MYKINTWGMQDRNNTSGMHSQKSGCRIMWKITKVFPGGVRDVWNEKPAMSDNPNQASTVQEYPRMVTAVQYLVMIHKWKLGNNARKKDTTKHKIQ